MAAFFIPLLLLLVSRGTYDEADFHEHLGGSAGRALLYFLLAGLAIFILTIIWAKLYPVIILRRGADNVKVFLPSSEESINSLKRINRKQREEVNNREAIIEILTPVLEVKVKQSEYASEKELQEYIAKNIASFYFRGNRLHLVKGGVEYYAKDVGRIDILTKDEKGNFVIIETKLGRTADKTIGQVSRYMGWVDKHLNTGKKEVHGVIIGHTFDVKAKYATIYDNIHLVEYDLGLSLRNAGLEEMS